MQRNMDLARLILMEIEKHPRDFGWINIEIEGYSDEEISYHVKLLNQAGLIDAASLAQSNSPVDWIPKSLTWEGHEFLDAARNETIWNKAKKIIKEKGGAVTFDVLKTLLIELAKKTVMGGL